MTKGSERVFYGVTAVAAALLAAVYMFAPLESDDYWFLEGTQGMSHGWNMFLAACETMKERWLTETGRLGNLINPVFLALLPKWVFNVLSGAFFALSVVFGCRLADAKAGSIRSYMMLAAMVFFFPWYDYMFCVTFGINYVWGIALALMAVYYLLRPQRDRIRTAAVCVLCFAAGWFHEGFGAPMSCAAAVVVVERLWHRRLDSGYALKFLCLAAGTLMICFSPVFWNRAETAVSNIVKFPTKELVMQVGPCVMMFLLFVAALAVTAGIRQFRKRLKTLDPGFEKTLFLCVFLAASMVVTLKYYNGPRTGAGIVTFASVGILFFTRCWRLNPSRPIKFAVCAVVSAAVFVNLGFAVRAQSRLLKEYDRIVAMFRESPDGTIYCDLTYPVADLSMFKTTVRQFHERIPKRQLAWYLDRDKKMVILPSAMKGIGVENVKPTSMPGYYLYNGYILTTPDSIPEGFRIAVSVPESERVETRFRIDPFRDGSGREWVFIMPHIQTLDPDLRILDVVE